MNAILGGVILILGLAGIAAYLVVNNHPWFALLVLIICCSVSVKEGNKTIKNDDKKQQ